MNRNKFLICLGLSCCVIASSIAGGNKQNKVNSMELNNHIIDNVSPQEVAKSDELRIHYYRDDGDTSYFIEIVDSEESTLKDTPFNQYDGYGRYVTLQISEFTALGISEIGLLIYEILEDDTRYCDATPNYRYYTIPTTVGEDGIDLYLFKSDENIYEYEKDDDPNVNKAVKYVNALNAIDIMSQQKTKAQLSYSYTKEDGNYLFSNMNINFGVIVKEIYLENLYFDAASISKTGFAIAKKSYLDANGKTITEAFMDEESYVAIISTTKDYSEFDYTDENGVENYGDYVAFSANLTFGDKTAKYTDEYVAISFFLLSDTNYVFLQEKSCSVASLADEYVASDSFSSFSTSVQGSLQALGALND